MSATWPNGTRAAHARVSNANAIESVHADAQEGIAIEDARVAEGVNKP